MNLFVERNRDHTACEPGGYGSSAARAGAGRDLAGTNQFCAVAAADNSRTRAGSNLRASRLWLARLVRVLHIITGLAAVAALSRVPFAA